MSQPPSPPDAARVGPRVDPRGRVWLKAMTRPQLLAWAGDTLGARPAQADNLWAGLHRRLAADVSELDLDAELRARLAAVARLDALELHAIHRAADGTAKLALRTDDGAIIESVLIPDVTGDGHGDRSRATLCVSSQVGCAMNCQFCLTAKMGLIRHLNTAEIVEQLILARRHFPDVWISNVVFMGMGEPLANYDRCVAAIRRLHGALGLSARHLTVSTVGIVPSVWVQITRSNWPCGSAANGGQAGSNFVTGTPQNSSIVMPFSTRSAATCLPVMRLGFGGMEGTRYGARCRSAICSTAGYPLEPHRAR